MTEPSLDERLSCERDCNRLCIDFAWAVDSRRYDAFVALFVADGVFERPGLVCHGHAEIRRFLDARPPDRTTRHLCTNVRIDMTGPDSATGQCHALMFQSQEGQGGDGPLRYAPPVLVDYHDDFVRTPHGWRFKERKTTLIFLP